PQTCSPGTAFHGERTARPQRVRPHPPHRPSESGFLMTLSVLRTADAWWVHTPAGAARIDTKATTTAQLLADRAAVEEAASSTPTAAVSELNLLSPVTAPCRVVAQM